MNGIAVTVAVAMHGGVAAVGVLAEQCMVMAAKSVVVVAAAAGGS